MKNLMLISLFALFSFSLFAQSNVKLGFQSVYYPNVDANFVGPSASIESAMGNHFSLNLGLAYLTDHDVIAANTDIITRAFKIEPSVRFFPKKGLKGFFLGGKMSYSNFSSFLKSGNERVSFPVQADQDYVFGVGGALGFQANFSEHFVLNAEVGLEMEGDDGDAMGSLGISVGYKF
jgi:hypothetical protein